MTYEADDNVDPDCINGNGDINEVTAEVCTALRTYYVDYFSYVDDVEAQCIFNFTVDGREWDGCMISGIDDFTHPVFKCAIRTIKNRNTPYYFTNFVKSDGQQVNEVINAAYCPTNSISYHYDWNSDLESFEVKGYFFNSDGPVFGPNGEYELDPENNQCGSGLPMFGTCKNNCRGGIYNYAKCPTRHTPAWG